MENRLIPMLIGITVAIVMIAGVLMPVVDDAADGIGSPITLTNESNSSVDYRYDYLDTVEYSITVESDGTYSIMFNGIAIDRINDNFPIYFSDVGYSEAYSTSDSKIVDAHIWGPEIGDSLAVFVTASTVGTTTVTFDDGVCTVTSYNGDTKSMPYTWVMGISPNGDYITYNGSITDLYVRNVEDMVTYSGVYQTGENDTYYAFAQGKGYAQGEFSDKIGLEYVGASLVEGTTNIYTGGNARLIVDDETFTPYRCIIKEKVTGNEADEPFTLIKTIPLLVIVSLFVAIAAAIFRSRD